MNKTRLESFSDGVIAIIITIMVFKIKAPQGSSWYALVPLIPVGLSYVLSFTYLAVYWNNHHHLLASVKDVNGAILWSNLYFLFWLSLLPVFTIWMGDDIFAQIPLACYGIIQLMIAIAYLMLQTSIKRHHGAHSAARRELTKDLKAKAALAMYIAAIASCYFSSWIAGGIYVLVALMWLLPVRKTEPVRTVVSDMEEKEA